MKKAICTVIVLIIATMPAKTQYTMPLENEEHEGTWLQWPHNFTYPPFYKEDLEDTWVSMTRELIKGENVHIIAYDSNELEYIAQLLINEGISLDNIDFLIKPNDDVWVRDNGAIFVRDANMDLHALDWGFNGWGGDTPFELCNTVPPVIAGNIGLPVIDLNSVVLEGGAFEIDGNGTLMATRSSILEDDRNPNWTEAEIESFMTTYLGVSNFIWLDGVSGLEITDMHIDGFARFHSPDTIVTMNSTDLTYWEVPNADINTLMNATNVNGQSYDYVILPLTQNDVTTTWGQNLGYRGSYVNYYVANAVVLVPTYSDPNDAVAIDILQDIYPDKEVVGIDVRNLYASGGMVHCVTQQQPLSATTLPIEIISFHAQQRNCNIHLEWQTEEVNFGTDRFVVERSGNGKDFIFIGEVDFTTNSNYIFDFLDIDPLPKNYYRLRQIDLDGHQLYSQVIYIENKCTTNGSKRLSLTLLHKSSSLAVEGELIGEIAIQIINGSGQVVHNMVKFKLDDYMIIQIPVASLSKGIYFIKITAPAISLVKSLKMAVH